MISFGITNSAALIIRLFPYTDNSIESFTLPNGMLPNRTGLQTDRDISYR